MCGIAGCVFAQGRLSEDSARQVTSRMIDRMKPRGPDAVGAWSGDGIVLGHRRLAIVDLDTRANQPMHSRDGRHVLVFNGEIYNYRELRRELEFVGVTFETSSDSEVLLALFAREGALMLPRLRGMFAFAVWDTQTRALFLARDPYGIKPLYYARVGSTLLFASQVKALLASQLISREREPAGLAGFYLFGSVPEPWTMHRDVLALPAGHTMWVRDGVASPPTCWHDIRKHWRGAELTASRSELAERVRDAVADSVRAHMVADVPVSVFLSGGIDSATIAALAREQGVRVEAITVAFDEFAGRAEDEAPVAAEIAAHYGLPHTIRRVTRAEFDADLPRILDAMDQPSIDGVNTWFASKASAERGYKVVLSGVGGDELFCGYSSFRNIPRAAHVGRAIARLPGARALMRRPLAALARRRRQPKLVGVPDFMGSIEGAYFLSRSLFLPSELPVVMGAEAAATGLSRLIGSPPAMQRAEARDGAAAIGLLESTHYLRDQLLRDSDWASMAHSLELRTPLVDAKLLSTLGPYVAGFARGRGKQMLASSPRSPLPRSIIQRRKTGFGVPMGRWLSLPSPWARGWAGRVAEQS